MFGWAGPANRLLPVKVPRSRRNLRHLTENTQGLGCRSHAAEVAKRGPLRLQWTGC